MEGRLKTMININELNNNDSYFWEAFNSNPNKGREIDNEFEILKASWSSQIMEIQVLIIGWEVI